MFCCCNYFRQNTFLVVQEVRGDTQLEGYASVTPSTHLAEKQCSGARGGKAEKAGYATAPWGKAMGNTSWFVLFFSCTLFFFFFLLCNWVARPVAGAAAASTWEHQESKWRPEAFPGIVWPLRVHGLHECWEIAVVSTRANRSEILSRGSPLFLQRTGSTRDSGLGGQIKCYADGDLQCAAGQRWCQSEGAEQSGYKGRVQLTDTAAGWLTHGVQQFSPGKCSSLSYLGFLSWVLTGSLQGIRLDVTQPQGQSGASAPSDVRGCPSTVTTALQLLSISNSIF